MDWCKPCPLFTADCACSNDVERHFDTLQQDWKMERHTVDELFGSGDRVVMLGHMAWTHERTGKRIETPKADCLRMQDGKLVEFFEFHDTARALEAAS